MTVVSGTIEDVGFSPLSGTLVARAVRFIPSGEVVVAPEGVPFPIAAGVVEADIAPGPVLLTVQVGSHARDSWEVTVPEEGPVLLADLVEGAVQWDPPSVSRAVQAARDAIAAAERAERDRQSAEDAAEQTGQDRSHVDQVRVLLDEAYDESQAGMALPPRLTETALNATYATRLPAAHSTFTHLPDGPVPTHTTSGHPFAYYIADDIEVRDGLLRSKAVNQSSGSHAELSFPRKVTRMGAVFRFDSVGGTRTEGGLVAINAWADGGIAANGGGRRSPAHVDLTPTSCGLGIRDTEGVGQPINTTGGRYQFTAPLELDTWYTVEWFITGDTAVVLMPDGGVHVVTDPRIASIPATFADFQLTRVQGDDDPITEIREVWADCADDGTPQREKLSIMALQAAQRQVLSNNRYIQALDSDGTPRNILGYSSNDTVRLVNGKAPGGNEVQLFADTGEIAFLSGNTRVARIVNGMMHHNGTVTVAANGISIHAASVSGNPNDNDPLPDANRGSLLMTWSASQSGHNTLFVKTTSGWDLVGHPTGPTTWRPSAAPVGMSFFDQTLGKPIWWSGSAWVDATGTAV